MRLSKLTFLLAILAFLLPVAATGSDIDIQTNSVRASTNRDGSVYIQTGDTSVKVPPRRSYYRRSYRSWYPWQFWRRSWNSGCQNKVYQRTTQTTHSGGRVVHSSTSTSSRSCR
ncbi:MAG: hypothetical protein QNJ41_24635 [Xenococcaceae cyanobacterium MO_188.B32]|nr:hypothetical protein [Xenococcaceae cyanobacterium MO_188.B32]